MKKYKRREANIKGRKKQNKKACLTMLLGTPHSEPNTYTKNINCCTGLLG